jgi:hypothetical protein
MLRNGYAQEWLLPPRLIQPILVFCGLQTSSVLLTGLLISASTHRLEHFLGEKKPNLHAYLKAVYEYTILGNEIEAVKK